MKNYYIVPHTHWDREWYFTKEETKVYLRNHMIDVIYYLEKNPDIKYMLDGQTVMVDDFKELDDTHLERFESLIKNNQLLIGPWYTQTDLLLPNQESIVRNLFYGIDRAKKYTDSPMLIGYAPDTFGHNAQMPQIYNQFGIKDTIFWRGVSKEISDKGIFQWEGLDGSIVHALVLVVGYQGGKYLPVNIEELKQRINTIEEKYGNYGIKKNIIIMNGHDQMPLQKDIKEVAGLIKKIRPDDNIKITTLEKYIKNMKTEIGNIDTNTVKGNLDHPEFTRIHRTISSTRMDIKQLNYKTEALLYNVLEPLSYIALKYGIPYPSKLIDKVLLLLFGVHAHDSLGGCNSDEVNYDIKARLNESYRLVVDQINLTRRLLTEGLSNSNEEITIINTLPYKRTNTLTELEVHTDKKHFTLFDSENNQIDYELISQTIQDMADIDRQILARREDVKMYKNLIRFYIPEIKGLEILKYSVIENQGRFNKRLEVDNKFEIRINNNQINLLDKKNDIIHENFLEISSVSDDGDSYDYSPLENDPVGEVKFTVSDFDYDNEKLIVELNATLPFNLDDRLNNKITTDQLVVLTIENLEEYMVVNVETTNKVLEHKLLVNFNFNNSIKEVKSDLQFGEVKRVNNERLLDVWKKRNWVEKPVPVHKFQSYITVNKKYQILNNETKEFSYAQNRITMPLYRSFSYLGKSDLVNRPGRASGMNVRTPDNELLNIKFNQTYALSLVRNNNQGNTAKEYFSPLIATQVKKYNKLNINKININTDYNFKGEIINSENFTISTVKKCEKSNKLLIRGFNNTEDTIVLRTSGKFYKSDLKETLIGTPTTKFTVESQQILTLIKENE